MKKTSLNYWQNVFYKLKKNPLNLFSLIFIITITILAIFGPYLLPYSYYSQDFSSINQPPTLKHWFGTDSLGRDLFVRVLYGARISLSIAFVASLINLIIGVIYGGISGYFGGKIDNIMMRIVDILYGIPLLLYIILLMVILKPGLINIFIAMGIAYWLDMARIVRGEVLKLKEQEFVLAAKSIGCSHLRIIFRHILPNITGPVIVTLTLNIPLAIFTEAFLSYIGLGVSAPMASWGVLAAEGTQSIRTYPHLLFFPAVVISLTMLSFNILGDGLRDALDPLSQK